MIFTLPPSRELKFQATKDRVTFAANDVVPFYFYSALALCTGRTP
jgi:hypothetical protein